MCMLVVIVGNLEVVAYINVFGLVSFVGLSNIMLYIYFYIFFF